MKEYIDKDMTIEEIFETFPHKSQKLAQEMLNMGLACVGCGASSFETLESGVLGHGYEIEDLESLVVRLNAVLDEPMQFGTISLTKEAAEKFKTICNADGKEGWGLRFGDRPGGCSGYEYTLEFSKEPTPEDEVYECHGMQVHVHKSMVSRLLGSEIDYHDGLKGSGFKISNPNVKGSCGCGSSQTY